MKSRRTFHAQVLLILSFAFLAVVQYCDADEIGFIERFALAKDREAVLKELVPGTEDYYYFHCLHYQNIESYDAVNSMTKKWIAKFGYTKRVREILNRQALLTYELSTRESLDYLIKQLNLKLNHERENFQGPTLPSALDQKLVSRETLKARALARYSNTNGFETRALDWLIDSELGMADLRHLLQRISIPDHPKLVDLIIRELGDRYSRGFGSMTIHRNLTKTQLQELAKKYAKVANQQNYVNIYLTKIRPGADVDMTRDDKVYSAHLKEMWEFVGGLAPVHNSLKASVLYHQLAFDRRKGEFDRDKFMEYLKLPRNSTYTNPKFLKREENRRYICNLNSNFQSQTLLAPIRNDNKLIGDYLRHFFKSEPDYKAFEPYLVTGFLKRQFAESKIVNGLGDPEKWASYISASEYQAIRERVDLDFAYSNKMDFGSNEEVSLRVNVKNVSKLIVKVFEINTRNFYRDRQVELNTNIELDGLLPNSEKVFEYKQSPFLRREIKFSFPELSERGAYVVDFIGNRKSCRALIRKGKLRYIEEITAAGHELTLVNEKNQTVKNGSLWIQGREIKSDKEGKLIVPFSGRPGNYPIVLSDGQIDSLDLLNHRAENYSLAGGFYVDRESLVAGHTAKLLLRSVLRINGRQTSLKLLEDVKLILTSVDFDGTVSTKEIKDFELKIGGESEYEIKVPERLQALTAQLIAKVKNLSRNNKETLSLSTSFNVNRIETQAKIEDLYLTQANGKFYVDLLGKNGEQKVARPVKFEFKHRDFKNVVAASLQTDMRGRTNLGRLDQIDWVAATGPEGTKRRWTLPQNNNRFRSVNIRLGESFQLPLSKATGELSRKSVSLFSLVNNRSTYEKDFFSNVTFTNGMLTVSELPAGDYTLRLKEEGRAVEITVSRGDKIEAQIIGQRRLTPNDYEVPIHVTGIDRKDGKTTISVAANSELSRVHVVATRYLPRFQMSDLLNAGLLNQGPSLLPQSRSVYVDGRKIGDEYQYILDRKYAEKYPGLMLKRPGLLLQPWAVRSTQTSKQNAQAGNKFAPGDDSRSRKNAKSDVEGRSGGGNVDESTMDFLPQGSVLLSNLAIKDGKVEIDNKLFKGNQQIHIFAVDESSTAYRSVSFGEQELEPDNRVFVSGLNPDEMFARRKEISFVDKGAEFKLTDIRTGRFEVYDNLPSIYRLFQSLNPDAKLAEFGFILDWRNKKAIEKKTLYSRYACHELNFFISRKDPEFFKEVVGPYLKNKKDKTFMDHFLLGSDLTNFLKPWEFSQLNSVEKILLAKAIGSERDSVKRYTSDNYNNNPTPQSRFEELFQYALSRSALDTSRDGLEKAFESIRMDFRAADEEDFDLAGQRMKNQSGGQAGESIAGVEFGRANRGRASGGGRDGKPDAKRLSDLAKRPKPAAEAPATSDDDALEMSLQDLQLDYKQNNAVASKRFLKLAEKRKSFRQLFRQVEKTKEWAENNYYHLPIGSQNAGLVKVNRFWNDFAAHDPAEPFFSVNFAEATHNFTEMMFALAVLDLDWKSAEHETMVEESQIKLKAKSPLLIFHEQIRPAIDGRKGTTVLVSQNFFRIGDRYRYEGPDRLDKFITDEFVKQTAYGCQIVVTNPTSSKQKIDLLVQVPKGSLPLSGSLETRSVHVELEPYRTSAIEYFFYFPESGTFEHYPVHVAKNEEIIAFAESQKFKVVNEPSKIDRSSWTYISQYGTNDEVLKYLNDNNLQRIDLNRIAWRMKEKDVFQSVTKALDRFHIFNPTLWAYAFKHNQPEQIAEFLQFRNDFVSATGAYIKTRLMHNDRIARKTYEHLEYDPLVNARVHQLGAARKILNDRFHAQYHRLLGILACKSQFESMDHLALTYYMLLQERMSEAQSHFAQATAGSLQYDYMAAYLDMLDSDTQLARRIASRYRNYPVDRWRKAFLAVLSQLDEIDGKKSQLVDDQNRTEVQSQLASNSPTFDFKVDAREVKVDYANLKEVRVDYYVMDVELLFSRNPFVKNVSGELTYIRPKQTQVIKLPDAKSKHSWKLPRALDKSNVLIEVSGGGQTKSQAYYAHALSVQMMESYGQLKVNRQQNGRALPKTYCKVYAKMRDGQVKFYKDGYTDLRGRFDYASLSTNDLDNVSKFSVLVMSDDLGATVQEVSPPKR